MYSGVDTTLKRLRSSKGDYWNKQQLSSVASPFLKKGTSLKENNLLPKGASSFFKGSS